MSENKEPFDENKLEDAEYLSSIFENASSDHENDDGDDLFEDENKGKKKKVVLLSSGVALVIAISAAIMFWNPIADTLGINSSNSQQEGDPAEVVDGENAEDYDFEEDDIEGADESFAMQDGEEFPIEVEDWETVSRAELSEDEIHEYNIEKASVNNIATDASVLPQETAGFTGAEDAQTLDDGSLNPMYSYWTAEQFQSEVSDITTRLLNPVYGGWGLYQYPTYKANSQFDMSLIEDMFTQDWIEENSGSAYSEYVPVYADWNENDYGLTDTLLVSGNRWVGDIQNVTSDFTYDEIEQQYTVDMTIDVQFSAWTTEQESLERDGTLQLTLVSNAQGANSSSNYKVLVDEASLTVDGA